MDTTPLTLPAELARAAPTARSSGPPGFADLYRRELEPMTRLAFLMCGDRGTASEIVHDAFVLTCERWSRIDQHGAYLRTIVVNRCRDAGRRRRFRSSKPVPDVATGGEPDVLSDALDALSDRQRIAIVLRFYLDLSEAEIARQMGVRPGTVKSLLSRGLATLRSRLVERTPAPATPKELP